MYDILESDSMSDLIRQVKLNLSSGWQCQGGVCFALGSYLQAMYREIPKWQQV